MRVFLTAFAGGFAGKLAAALFIAVCLLMGFGPDKWATYAITGLAITPGTARVAFFVFAALTFVLVFGPPLVRRTKSLASSWKFRPPWERRSTNQIKVVEVHHPAPERLSEEDIQFRKALKSFGTRCAPDLSKTQGQLLALLKEKEADGSPRSVTLHFLVHETASTSPNLEPLRDAVGVEIERMDLERVQSELIEFLRHYEWRQKLIGNLIAIVGRDRAIDVLLSKWLGVDGECAKELTDLTNWQPAVALKKHRPQDFMATVSGHWIKQHEVNYPNVTREISKPG